MATFCLDDQPAVSQGAGIGRYTRQLAVNLLPALAPDERLRLFFCDFRRKAARDPVPGAEARAFRLLPGALMQKAWTKLGAPAFDRLAGAADVVPFANFVARPVRRGRVAVSIHDMSFERFPQFAEKRNYAYLHANVARGLVDVAYEVGVIPLPVDVRLADAEKVEVRPVQDQDLEAGSGFFR